MTTGIRKPYAPRKYPPIKSGISMSEGNGRINISIKIIEYLEYSKLLKFRKWNDEYLAIEIGEYTDEDIYEVKEYASNGHAIYDSELVSEIYSWFGIKRNDKDVMSPFYQAEFENKKVKIDGKVICYRYVLIKMKNFDSFR